MGPVKLDMNTVQALYNSAEYYTTYLGITEMAKWMDIPNWGYAGTSDSQCVDANAGIDITELTLLSMQAGSNLNHDIGYLDFGLTAAGELVVLTDELVSMNRRALEGIEVSEETLALDTIAAVGQGGDFLGQKHTKRHVRDLQWRPTILNRSTQKNWEAEGSPDATEKAHRKLLDIMSNHTPEPLSAEMKQTMDGLVDAYIAAGA
jgi:trimethylamine--corrinoid protein Co-methyltransferase